MNELPVIIIDTREQEPLDFRHLPSLRGTLYTGDYSFVGGEHHFAVERKSIPDLVASVTHERERFERECHRLRGFHFKRLVVTGTEAEVERGEYRSKANPKSVLHSLWAFEVRYDIPVVWLKPAAAARQIEKWAYWMWREIELVAERAKRERQDVVPRLQSLREGSGKGENE